MRTADATLLGYEAVDTEGNRTRMRFLDLRPAKGLKPADFAFRPPARIAHLKNMIRASAHYLTSGNAVCLQTPGQATCVPYVDSRQSQTQVTFDTDFPPSLSAGFQMAYLVNDERQTNHKTAQLVITAFVNFSTSVGQIR